MIEMIEMILLAVHFLHPVFQAYLRRFSVFFLSFFVFFSYSFKLIFSNSVFNVSMNSSVFMMQYMILHCLVVFSSVSIKIGIRFPYF